MHRPLLPKVGYENRFDPSYDGPLRQALIDARAAIKNEHHDNPFTEIHQKYFKPILRHDRAEDHEFYQALYDAELSWVDEELADLFAWLRTEDLYDETVIIVTSDHGEEFGEHGRQGHHQLYRECLHVPLLVRLPGGPRGAIRDDPAELLDVMPSLLATLKLPIPESCYGTNLDWLSPDPKRELTPRVAEINAPGAQRAWSHGSWKLLWPLDESGDPLVFHLATDPNEQIPRPIGDEELEVVALANRWLAEWQQNNQDHVERFGYQPIIENLDELTDAMKAELAALGYLE